MFTVNNLTPDSCQSVCKERGHAYAGVQYGYLCHCGDAYGKYGEAEDRECSSACLGDEGMKCGGFWRNSVYTSGEMDCFVFSRIRCHSLSIPPKDTTFAPENRYGMSSLSPTQLLISGIFCCSDTTSGDKKLDYLPEDSSDERETRSHIDRLIPIPQSGLWLFLR